MKPYIIGKKIGMTQIFASDGFVIPVTVIEAVPCIVTQIKSVDKDGYAAIQIGSGIRKSHTKPLAGHLQKAGSNSKILKEVRINPDEKIKVGEKLDVGQFETVKEVQVSGISKGKGFSGVIKRHNFSRGPETHGSDHHRRPGSIGSMFPQRVLKGRKLPGHMGSDRITVKGLELVQVDKKNNLLMIRGALPGPTGNTIEITGVSA